MSCTNPLYAIKYENFPGKYSIRILGHNSKHISGVSDEARDQYKHGKLLKLPCGHCESCLKDRSKVWALRCVLESSCYEENYFVTLTYRDECNPGTLSRKDFRQFIKNVRNKFGSGIRYFGCGEYGTTTFRPHYHLIMFNLKLPDVKHFAHGAYGGNILVSKELEKCWPFGNIQIGEVSFASCNYVARYVLKKQGMPSFQSMSTHPGIGYPYFEKHHKNIYECDACYLSNGTAVKPPRYFDRCFEKIDLEALEKIKFTRVNEASVRVLSDVIDHALSSEDDLIGYKEILNQDKIRKRKDL